MLVRHGETEWSRAGRHTGRTDVPLSERGRENAKAVGRALRDRRFATVLTSPLSRARDTCALAGFAAVAQERDDLVEWDYGADEGRTTPEIREQRAGWTLWRDGVPDGETADQVGARADRIVAELRASPGDKAVVSHGHLLRVLAARWLGLEPTTGRLFALDAAAIGVLGYERETPVIQHWNEPPRAAL